MKNLKTLLCLPLFLILGGCTKYTVAKNQRDIPTNKEVEKPREVQTKIKDIYRDERVDYETFSMDLRDPEEIKVYMRKDGIMQIISYYDTNSDGYYDTRLDTPFNLGVKLRLNVTQINPPEEITPKHQRDILPKPLPTPVREIRWDENSRVSIND